MQGIEHAEHVVYVVLEGILGRLIGATMPAAVEGNCLVGAAEMVDLLLHCGQVAGQAVQQDQRRARCPGPAHSG